MPLVTPGMMKFREKVKLFEDQERLKEVLELKDRIQHDLTSLIQKKDVREYPDYLSFYNEFGTIDYDDPKNLIAKGSFTRTFKVVNPNTQETRAIKVIRLNKSRPEYVEKFLPRQLNTLIFLTEHQHENIMKIGVIARAGEHIFIESAYFPLGNVKQYRSKIKLPKRMDENLLRIWLRQLISAIEFLHYYCIAHRNITPENILIATENSIVLSGFGFSRFCYDVESGTFRKSSSNRDPDPFLAPEIIDGETADPKCGDIWSFGAMFYYLVTGDPPYLPNQQIAKGVKASNFVYKPYHAARVGVALSARVSRLIECCLVSDASKRATLQHVKLNPWFKDSEPVTSS
ncbi:testis-specific serine/threonine-protein kinase 2-like [Panonychus citri]|uniref:testis-specific serine/threonine-protein kinase 2-like n=1 Tax=Panonychus citri TaxID=50023 RepID=UPI0023070E9E|nr:testis-specific serine/threonine-protein kinase 2-like [Panonychus citri]